MRRFFYFIPGQRSKPNYERLRELGLSHAFNRQESFAYVPIESGPGKQQGALIARGSESNLCFDEDEQIWQKIGPEGCVWIGMSANADLRPRPFDLQRSDDCTEGIDVVLGDNCRWRVPIVRRMTGGTALPVVLTYDDNGEIIQSVSGKYERLYQMATRIRRAVFDEDSQVEISFAEVSGRDLLRLAGEALSVNYFVSDWELGLLKVIDTVNVRFIGDAILDAQNLREFISEIKKKEDDGRELGPGS